MSPWVTPKENWVGGVDNPLPSDFNRIESNTNYINDGLIAEIAARVAAILAEQGARADADLVLQGNIDSEAGTRYTDDVYEASERAAGDLYIRNTVLAGKLAGNASGNIPISNGSLNVNLLATYATSALNAGESDTAIKLTDKDTSGYWQLKYIDGLYCDVYFNGTRVGSIIFD